MKFVLQLFLSIFLAMNIVAPSFISIIENDKNMELVIDHSEEDNQKENKEGEKESSDKDTFFQVWNNALASILSIKSNDIIFHLEGYNYPTLNIVLPPPEFS